MRKTKFEMLKNVSQDVQFSKIVGNNTVKYKRADSDNIYIRLHLTDIIAFHKNHIILNTDGWKTPTTKNRINEHQSLCEISQDKGMWYVKTKIGMKSVFYDNIKILNTGRIIKPLQDDKKTKRLLKQINAYCKKLSNLKTLPLPSSGDCWYCSMVTVEDQKPLGEAVKNTSHLISHLKEKYIHGSLIFNALSLAGYNNPAFIYQMDVRNSITRAVKRYFKRQLGIAY